MISSRIKIVGISLVVLLSSFAVLSQKYVVKGSKVKFKIKNAGVYVSGYFNTSVVASINFDPEDLSNSKITASILTKTLSTGNAKRDKHVKSDDYLDCEKYPRIKMVSNSIKKVGNKYVGNFSLTVKKTTKKMDIPFTYTKKGDDYFFKSHFPINRKAFGVGGRSIIMGNEILVDIYARAKLK